MEPTVTIGNEQVSVRVVTAMGPRLLHFADSQGRSPFTETPDMSLPVPDGRSFRLVGGHRLWAAPEDPAATYIPDDDPPVIEELASGLRFTQPAPPETGLEKTVEVRVPGGAAQAVITHRLTNQGREPVQAAPWAITMLRPGGTALIPVRTRRDNALQADRAIVLWPYTQLSDAGIEVGDDAIAVHTDRTDPTKIGTALHRGWLAYVTDDQVFVKRAGHLPDRVYADLGASGQVYANAKFCELETLGPLTVLAPAASISHREVWELYDRADLPVQRDKLLEALDQGPTP